MGELRRSLQSDIFVCMYNTFPRILREKMSHYVNDRISSAVVLPIPGLGGFFPVIPVADFCGAQRCVGCGYCDSFIPSDAGSLGMLMF